MDIINFLSGRIYYFITSINIASRFSLRVNRFNSNCHRLDQ